MGALKGEKEKRFHPTQKPIKLFKWIIKTFCKEGDIVCDPFIGSGTTGVACVEMKCQFIGIEKDPEYFEIAKRRIEAAGKGRLF